MANSKDLCIGQKSCSCLPKEACESCFDMELLQKDLDIRAAVRLASGIENLAFDKITLR